MIKNILTNGYVMYGLWNIKQDLEIKSPNTFLSDESGIGVVEIVLILVVLVALVVIFQDQLTELINSVFGSINSKAEGIYQ